MSLRSSGGETGAHDSARGSVNGSERVGLPIRFVGGTDRRAQQNDPRASSLRRSVAALLREFGGSISVKLLRSRNQVVLEAVDAAAQPSRSFSIAGHLITESVPLRRSGVQRKRALDVVVSFTALVLMAPIMAVIFALIKATSPGPAVFAQVRVGQNGKTFRCYKFRTMVVDADRRLAEHLASNPAAAREWQETRKLFDDPRVTRIGRVLRISSLDELPQFFNVLRGDMSCVGPRPIVPEELERYGDHVEAYLAVRPGITGLWQVCGRNSLSYEQRVALDAFYDRSRSLSLDLAILVATIPAVLSTSKTA